jgi:hypothetical protein
MELIEVKSLIWAQKGKLYIIYEKVASQWGFQLIFRMHNSDPTPKVWKIEILFYGLDAY